MSTKKLNSNMVTTQNKAPTLSCRNTVPMRFPSTTSCVEFVTNDVQLSSSNYNNGDVNYYSSKLMWANWWLTKHTE